MVKAVSKALDMLDLILESAVMGSPLGLGDIASAIGVQNTTARNILKTLEQSGYVSRGQRRTYLPGPKCSDMRIAGVLEQLREKSVAVIDELARQSGHSVVLAVLMRGCRRVLLRCEGAAVVKIDPLLAESGNFYSLVTSRVLAAFCSDSQRSVLIDSNGTIGDGWQGVDSMQDFLREISVIRQQGYCVDYPGPQRLAMAVPVMDAQGQLLAALGTHMPVTGGCDVDVEKIFRPLREAASRIGELVAAE